MKKSKKVGVSAVGQKTLKEKIAKDWSMNKWKYLMILPVVIYLILFCYKPMYGLVIAFKNYKLTRGIEGSPWVSPWYYWFQNYFEDPYFWRLIRNTFMLSGLTILFGFPAPIILALLLNELTSNKFKRVVQTITYMPYFISMVVMCSIIKIFCQQNGLFSTIAEAFGGTGQNYLMNASAFPVIYVLSDIWQRIGWNSIIYLAALTSIDQQLYEAAKVDGANRWQLMLHVTLPGLMPTIVVMFILRMGNIVNVGYEKILLLYNPSIYSVSDVISTYIYRLSFPTSTMPLYSKATAIGLFNSLINVVFLLFTNWLSKKTTESSLF